MSLLLETESYSSALLAHKLSYNVKRFTHFATTVEHPMFLMASSLHCFCCLSSFFFLFFQLDLFEDREPQGYPEDIFMVGRGRSGPQVNGREALWGEPHGSDPREQTHHCPGRWTRGPWCDAHLP